MNRNILITTTLFLFCFGVYIFSAFRGYDPDLWGHLKFGEYIVTHLAIPYKDLYAFTPTKPLWVNHEWLFEVISYLLMSMQKDGLVLLLFKAVACAGAILIPWGLMLKQNRFSMLNFFLFIVIILCFSYGTAVRPQIFSYLFFALMLLIIESYQLKGKQTYISLGILFIVWVNTHGGVMAGLAYLYAYCFLHILYELFSGKCSREDISASESGREEQTEKTNTNVLKKLLSLKIIALPFVLTVILVVNPYFTNYYSYILDAISMKRPFIEEWSSVLANVWMFKSFILLCIIAIAAFLFALKEKQSQTIINFILLFILMVMAFKSYRHIPFFAVACGFYVPGIVARATLKHLPASLRLEKFSLISLLLVISSIFFTFITFFSGNKFNYQLVVYKISDYQYTGYPVKAVKFIKESNLTGTMLVNFNWGEYIIYQLSPDIKVSIDGRYETVYPEDVVKQNISFITAQENWKSVLENYNPDYVLISINDAVYPAMIKGSYWPILSKEDEYCLFVNPVKLAKLINGE